MFQLQHVCRSLYSELSGSTPLNNNINNTICKINKHDGRLGPIICNESLANAAKVN